MYVQEPAASVAPSLKTSPYRSQNPLLEKLNRFVELGEAERTAIIAITEVRRIFQPEETLVHEGSRPDRICMIVSGVASRYRYLSNGRRQIFGYLLPGDLCDSHFVICNKCDHNVGLLCATQVAFISLRDLMSTMVEFPKIERALMIAALVDAAILREWLLNVGQRHAVQRLAHFFCELSARFGAGLHCRGEGLSLPLTQSEIADTMGLSVNHVNRVLQRFRRDGLLCWSRHHFKILDYPALAQLAGFETDYLRLEPEQMQPNIAAYG